MRRTHLSSWLTAGLAAALCAATVPASASVLVDFSGEFAAFGPGQASASHSTQGLRLTATGGDALVDFSFCSFPDYCTTGNATEHLQAYNDAVITLDIADGSLFRLFGFDAAFLPSPFVDYSGADVRLQVDAVRADGGIETVLLALPEDFSNGGGDYAFASFAIDPSWGLLSSVSFQSCFYDGTDCIRATGLLTNDAQFALDNLLVPEPASLALTLGALAGLGALRRSRRALAPFTPSASPTAAA